MPLLRDITSEYIGSLKYAERIIDREIPIKPVARDIMALVGPRRSGKTFLMLLRARELLEGGEQVIYVNFDEPSVSDMDARTLATEVRREYPRGKVYLFMDEVQEWEEWDRKLRWLHDVMDFNIVVTGSSSSLLASEIPSRLRGRYSSVLVLPFSFREISREVAGEGFRGRGKLLRLFDEYLEYGGFPEVWLYKSREKLINILNTCLYRDIIERFDVRDISVFRDVFFYVLSNYSNKVTLRSLKRLMEARGVKLDVKTISNYLSYMEAAFLVFTVKIYAPSERKKLVRPRKVYVVDHGVAKLYPQGLYLGRVYENVVFIELLRRGYDIYYYDYNGLEVDFVVLRNNRVVKLVEVTYEDDQVVGKVEKLRKAMRALRCPRAEMVTRELREDYSTGNAEIKVRPLWEWLLGRD